MKEKQEILNAHCKDERGIWIGLTMQGVLDAMEEYARQFYVEEFKCLSCKYKEIKDFEEHCALCEDFSNWHKSE